MRTMKFLSLVGMSVTLLLAGSCVPLKYVPKANEGTLGTWITEKTPRKTVVTAEGWKDFMFVDDPDPGMAGVGQIESKWTDSKGDIWYRKYITITQGD